MHPHFDQTRELIELTEEVSEVFTFVHRFVKSRTGCIFGLKSLSKEELEEVLAAGRYYLFGNEKALGLFEEQVRKAHSGDEKFRSLKAEIKAVARAVESKKHISILGHVHTVDKNYCCGRDGICSLNPSESYRSYSYHK